MIMQATVMVVIQPEAAEVCVWNNELFHPDLPLEAQTPEALISHFPLSATGAVVMAHMLLTAAIRLSVETEPTPEQIDRILGDLEIDL